MLTPERQLKHLSQKEYCPSQNIALQITRRRPTCLPEILLQPRHQTLPV
jgi:hypothetical protein